MVFWNRASKHQPLGEPASKRISTPAGQRLSIVLEKGDAQKQTRSAHRASMRKSGAIAAIGEVPRESNEDESSQPSGYSYSVWSDGDKFAILKDSKRIARRGGWKRVLIILAIVLAILIAFAVGLAVGLRKKSPSSESSGSKTPNTTDPSDTGSPNLGNQDEDSASPQINPTATSTNPLSPTTVPSNFPIGSYSIVTFLDTVQTNCTANPSTWTCHPYTEYNTDPVKAVATFNWVISSPSTGEYRISSTSSHFSLAFKNKELKLLDEGKDTERYRFQFSQTKTVTPTESLSDDGAETECGFANTSLQAYLYTKMERGYPDPEKGDPDGDPESPVWPYAVRVEQAAGGGENVPSCRKSNGKQITEGLVAQDAGALCSCLYKNWRTPSPY